MKKSYGLRMVAVLISLAALVALASVALAWSNDPTVNTAICTASSYQAQPHIASDGSDGAIITWVDLRSGYPDIYAQRVDSAGAVQWNANGAAICAVGGIQGNPEIASDGSGGAIITWGDTRSGTWDIYAQRVNSAGEVQWNANGVVISTFLGEPPDHEIASDGSEGAIITWHDDRGGWENYDIYAQRVDSAGAVQWTANGVAICTASGRQMHPTIVGDGSEGAIITWYDDRSGPPYDIYAQRVDAAGDVQWLADGVAICIASGSQGAPEILGDGSGGAIITWDDRRSGDWDIYAQRVDASGAVQWLANGVAISTASGEQGYAEIVGDGSAGAIITWDDGRDDPNGGFDPIGDIYAQRVDAAGDVQWLADGVAISTASGDQSYPQIVGDGSAGAIITWDDTRSGNSDIYAQRVNHSGTPLWTANGVAISTASGEQSYPQIVGAGSGGAIITWDDTRSGIDNWDIYAQRVNADGSLPSPTPEPDLVVSDLTAEWVEEGSTYNVTFRVCNNGSLDAGASVAGIYIDGSLEQSEAVGALGAGVCTDPVTVGPFTLSDESDTIEVRADKDNDVGESNEQNNSSQSSMPPPVGGCFIATAAYGTPMAEEIEALRDFRDEYLLTNPVGQALVELYYKISPPMAEFIEEHPALKPVVRAGLLPAVAMSTVAVNTTLAEKIAVVSLLALISVALAVWARKRRGRASPYSPA